MNELTKMPVKSKISVLGMGLGFGISWALGVLLLGVMAMIFSKYHYGSALMHVLSSVYIGYGATVKGVLIGAGWAIIDGFIWGVFIAWIYNSSIKLIFGATAK